MQSMHGKALSLPGGFVLVFFIYFTLLHSTLRQVIQVFQVNHLSNTPSDARHQAKTYLLINESPQVHGLPLKSPVRGA
jgi:hypothetical protein